MVSYYMIDYRKDQEIAVDEGKTNSMLDEAFSLYHKNGTHFDPSADAVYKLALMDRRGAVYDYFKEHYPNYELIICESSLDCIQMVVSGEADLTFLNNYVANHVLVEKDYDEIEMIPTRTVTFGICLQFYGENREKLASFFNKGLVQMSGERLQNIILDYSLNVVPEPTLAYLFKNNMALVIWSLIILIFAIIVLVIMLTYALIMRK